MAIQDASCNIRVERCAKLWKLWLRVLSYTRASNQSNPSFGDLIAPINGVGIRSILRIPPIFSLYMASFYFWVRFTNATLPTDFEVVTILGRRMPRIVDGFRPPKWSGGFQNFHYLKKTPRQIVLLFTGNQRTCSTL